MLLCLHQSEHDLFAKGTERYVKTELRAPDDLTASDGMIDSCLSVGKLLLACEPTVAELVDLGDCTVMQAISTTVSSAS